MKVLESPILPGACLGVLGGGQLGRMFVHAAQQMGYQTLVLDPDPASPAGAAAHEHLQAALDDQAALQTLAKRCQAVTTEFENVPVASLEQLSAHCFVAPAFDAVAIAQNRIEEKALLAQIATAALAQGLPSVPPVKYSAIESLDDIKQAPEDCFPGLLKTATLGYDGKGQAKVTTRSQALMAFKQLKAASFVLEQKAELAAECSIVLARSADGQCTALPAARNVHVNGVLAVSEIYEGNLPKSLVETAGKATELIANELNYVGVLCAEFFVLKDAQGQLSEASALRVNEIAPRPHNSGHWSIEGASISQFELQVRALCGLPWPAQIQARPSVMLNLLGDLWLGESGGEQQPDWSKILSLPGVNLHLYGKAQARPGRKMGHITITAPSASEAGRVAAQVAQSLGLPYTPSMPI